jgi:hypothetical protein
MGSSRKECRIKVLECLDLLDRGLRNLASKSDREECGLLQS